MSWLHLRVCGAQVTLPMTKPVAHGMRIPRASFPSATPFASNITTPELFNEESELSNKHLDSGQCALQPLLKKDFGFPLCVSESVVGRCSKCLGPRPSADRCRSFQLCPCHGLNRLEKQAGMAACVFPPEFFRELTRSIFYLDIAGLSIEGCSVLR